MALDRYQHLVGIPYELGNGPEVVVAGKSLHDVGTNCQALFHAVLALHGKTLPVTMRSKELFEDTTYFETIVQGHFRLHELDTVLFGSQRLTDPRKLHIAVHVGEHDEQGQPLLIHATRVESKVTIWPFVQFSLYQQYKRIYAVKRLRGDQR